MATVTEQEPLEKEEFSSSLDDEELLRQINEWYEEGEEFYSQLKTVWDQNIEYYRGNQTDVAQIYSKRQSKAVENRIFMGIETMIPIITARLPDIEVRSDIETERAQINAKNHQEVLGFQMERNKIQEKTERWVRDMFLKRYGVFKVRWEKDIDDVGLEVVDPRRIRVPRLGKSVRDLKFIIEDLEMSYDQVVDFFGEDVAKDLLQEKPEDSENKRRERTFSIQEVWTNEYVVWKGGGQILKKQNNPYFNFKNKKKNFFDKPSKPYIIKSIFHTEESIIGDTDYVQQLIRIQDNINIRKRQIEDIVNFVSNPNLHIDSDVMSEEEARKLSNEPGQIIYGKDAANEQKIKYGNPGQPPPSLFEDLQMSRNEFDNIMGIHSTTRGEREGRETATGRKLLRQADLGRVDAVARQLERALEEIAEWWTQLVKLFYTRPRSFSILGEDGLSFVRDFVNSKVEEVKLVVKPGSTLPKDEISIHQEALQLWQLKAIGLRTLYKMLKLPNVDVALQDFIETHSGQLLQRGGQQAIVPPAAEGLQGPEQTPLPPQ